MVASKKSDLIGQLNNLKKAIQNARVSKDIANIKNSASEIEQTIKSTYKDLTPSDKAKITGDFITIALVTVDKNQSMAAINAIDNIISIINSSKN